MKKDFLIIGGTGQQGRICSRDLLDLGYSVMIAGRNKEAVKHLLKNKNAGFIELDLRDVNNIVYAIKQTNPDVVVNCAELTYNINVMKACLKTKKSCTDLGGLQHITKEQFKLHGKFKKEGIISITGCGSTPGIANVMTSHLVGKFDSVDTIELGFAWDSNIKKFVVPYSIHSIFDEFTERPVVLHNGKFRKSDRMICMGTFNFREIGKQTAYCIVHSEVYTFMKYFKDKGLRNVHYLAGFPDHAFKVIKTLMDLGFASKEPVEVQGIKISPVDFTDKVLNEIKEPKDYKETENIWVRIIGKIGDKNYISRIECIVKPVKGWEEAGSNVDTGRTIAIISEMLKKGMIKKAGVFAPEAVVPEMTFFEELAKRGMKVYHDGKLIN